MRKNWSQSFFSFFVFFVFLFLEDNVVGTLGVDLLHRYHLGGFTYNYNEIVVKGGT